MQQKSDRLHLRVEPEVKKELRKEARELGCSLSDLIRMKLQPRLEKAIVGALEEALSGRQ